jgi:hypothetical protein
MPHVLCVSQSVAAAIKKPGQSPAFNSPCLSRRFNVAALGDDWSFLFPYGPIASEQHSSLAPPSKLALLRRSVKINVVQKQQSPRNHDLGASLSSSILKIKEKP